MTRSSLQKYRKNCHSQNGEDGIIREILNRLGVKKGFCVEFGAWDGRCFSNTYHLIEAGGWCGLYIEGDPERFAALRDNEMVRRGKIIPVQAYVASSGENTLDRILARHNVPADFELLSIDVDGDDLNLWAAFEGYRPKVVVIEIDSAIEPTVSRTLPDGHPERSFANMLRVGQSKGYALVCHTGNMIFVVKEWAARLGLDDELAEPEKLFCETWVRQKNSRLLRLKRSVMNRIHRIFRRT